MKARGLRVGVALALVLTLVVGGVVLVRNIAAANRFHVVAYFDNSNGLF